MDYNSKKIETGHPVSRIYQLAGFEEEESNTGEFSNPYWRTLSIPQNETMVPYEI